MAEQYEVIANRRWLNMGEILPYLVIVVTIVRKKENQKKHPSSGPGQISLIKLT